MRKPRQSSTEPDGLESGPPEPPKNPVEPGRTGRKRTRSVRQRQLDFINNNTRCDNKDVGTESAAVHNVQLRDPTPEYRTSYMEARRFMSALRYDTRKSLPNLGTPPGPAVHGPRPRPNQRTRHKLSIEMVPTPGDGPTVTLIHSRPDAPNPVLAYLAGKGLDCTPVAPRNPHARARAGHITDNMTTVGRDQDGELPALAAAAGTPPAQPPHPEHLKPQWWRPRWKVAREQILENRIPWKPGKGKTEDTTHGATTSSRGSSNG
jgi:hypothetical protein